MRSLPFAVAIASWVVGCGTEGVRVGSEEACALEAELVSAPPRSQEARALPACASIGRNQLVNQSMESPALASVGGCAKEFCHLAATQVSGWRTTAESQVIELWRDGYYGVPAPDGNQLVELDAQSADTLYQDVVLTPGEPVYWSVRHRGRLGDESIEVFLGAPESPASQGMFDASDEAWQEHSGVYRVGLDETVTRFALTSRSGTTEGNLVDHAILAPIELLK